MRRPIATVLLIALAFTGCHKWVEVESLHRDGGKDASVIRVTRTNGTAFRLYGPSVQSDSLIGSLYEPGQRRPPNAQRRFALAMESVERMERSARRTRRPRWGWLSPPRDSSV